MENQKHMEDPCRIYTFQWIKKQSNVLENINQTFGADDYANEVYAYIQQFFIFFQIWGLQADVNTFAMNSIGKSSEYLYPGGAWAQTYRWIRDARHRQLYIKQTLDKLKTAPKLLITLNKMLIRGLSQERLT